MHRGKRSCVLGPPARAPTWSIDAQLRECQRHANTAVSNYEKETTHMPWQRKHSSSHDRRKQRRRPSRSRHYCSRIYNITRPCRHVIFLTFVDAATPAGRAVHILQRVRGIFVAVLDDIQDERCFFDSSRENRLRHVHYAGMFSHAK